MIIVSLPWGKHQRHESFLTLIFLSCHPWSKWHFHFWLITEYQLNLSILRTARSWLFAVTFMFSIFYSKKKLSSPVFIGVVIMRLRVFIMRVHIKACVRVLKCSMKIYNPQTSHIIFEQNTGTCNSQILQIKNIFCMRFQKTSNFDSLSVQYPILFSYPSI